MNLLQSIVRGGYYMGYVVTGAGVFTLNPAVIVLGIVWILAARFIANRIGAFQPDRSAPSTGLTALAESGDVEGIKAALAGGADPNQGDRNGRLPLTSAAIHGHAEVVRLLLEHGVREKNEALCWGAHVAEAKPEIIRSLLKAGADPNAKDLSVGKPLGGAASCGYTEIVQVLLDGGAKVTDELIRARQAGHTQTAELLVLHAKGDDESMQNMLEQAVSLTDLDMVEMLIHAGAQRDDALGHAIVRGYSAGIEDIARSKHKFIRELVRRGADPSSVRVAHQIEAASHQPWYAQRYKDITRNLEVARSEPQQAP